MNPKIKKILISLIPIIGPFLLSISLFVLVIILIIAPVQAAKESTTNFANGVGDFFERFGGLFTGRGWNTAEEAYYKLIDKVGCEKAKIVTSTLMYYYQVSPHDEIDIQENNDTEEVEVDPEELPYGELLSDAKKLVKWINDEDPDKYEENVKNKLLNEKPYKKMLEGVQDVEAEKDRIYNDMISIASSVSCYEGSSGYYGINCPGVVVEGENAGTYPLEDYVAGVVANENPGAGPEGLKAQAIAARSYVLAMTNSCTTSIVNSDERQTFNPNPSEEYIKATKDTEGQVLTKNGNVIAAYYSSYPIAGYSGFGSYPACGSVTCNDTTCTTTMYQVPDLESFSFTMPIKNNADNYWNGKHLNDQGGHCYGFSQVGGRYLEQTGLNHEEILKTFYSPSVVISSSMGSGPGLLAADSTGFLRRVGVPDINNASDVNFWFSNNNLSYSTNKNLVGQCTWYAYGRANEILANAGSSYRWRHAPDAGQWYKYNLNDGANGFKSSMNINEPKVGAIMVLSGGKGAGHVMIVEAVYDNGDIAVSEGNITRGNPNPYGFRYIERIKPSDYVAQFSRNGYSFGGYIYLLN